jgi:hypothetical protein
MQISRNSDEQSAHLKASSEASERKINQQTEYFYSLSRIHLRSEHRESSSNLSDHRTVSIHLLCLDLIRSQRRTRLQAEKKRDIVLHEKHLNSSDTDHLRSIQKHCRRRSKHRALSVLNTSTARHDHLRRAAASNHQLGLFVH